MKNRGLAIVLLVLSVVAKPSMAGSKEIPLSGFSEGIKHWRNLHGEGYRRYPSGEFEKIADNLLLYQRLSGGWPKNFDPTRILSTFERIKIKAEKLLPGGSFDNQNVFPQVEYLAAAFQLTGNQRYLESSLRGLAFVIAHQDSTCGAWPHTIPARSSYHRHLTLADGVTVGALSLLRQVAAGEEPFGFANAALQERALKAVERGIACLLRLQIRQGQALTGWAGQYDRRSMTPAQGRAFEFPALDARETVEVLRYLMKIERPSPETVAAINAAAAWLSRVELRGWRLETFAAEPVRFPFHSSDWDRRLLADPSARLWARFYDLQDNRTVLAASIDGKRIEDYAAMSRERRTGYDWFGEWPLNFLELEYPEWRRRIEAKTGSTSAP